MDGRRERGLLDGRQRLWLHQDVDRQRRQFRYAGSTGPLGLQQPELAQRGIGYAGRTGIGRPEAPVFGDRRDGCRVASLLLVEGLSTLYGGLQRNPGVARA